RAFLVVMMFFATLSVTYAQDFYIEPKINVLAAGFGIVNPSVEFGFAKHSAIEFSNVTSFSKNDYLGTGYPLIVILNLVEYRHYLLNEEHKGLFLGGDFGWDMYKMNKSLIPTAANSDRAYDWGIGIVLGMTAGYKFLITDKLGVELYAAWGWQHTSHEPYYEGGVLEAPMNKSAEWIPYKAGVTLSYRFGFNRVK
ncbi:MAG: DUF3575 domain-containing protein, partial [Rikenellaceae bacterium]